jgi:hypothetical protein
MNKVTIAILFVIATVAGLLGSHASLTFADQCQSSNDCYAGEICVNDWGQNVCKSTDEIFGGEEEYCGVSEWYCDGRGYLYYIYRWQTGTGCREEWLGSGGCEPDQNAANVPERLLQKSVSPR